jgi:hypothetical protein
LYYFVRFRSHSVDKGEEKQKLFCTFCNGLVRGISSSVTQHLDTAKHALNLKRAASLKTDQRRITEFLQRPETMWPKGEGLELPMSVKASRLQCLGNNLKRGVFIE